MDSKTNSNVGKIDVTLSSESRVDKAHANKKNNNHGNFRRRKRKPGSPRQPTRSLKKSADEKIQKQQQPSLSTEVIPSIATSRNRQKDKQKLANLHPRRTSSQHQQLSADAAVFRPIRTIIQLFTKEIQAPALRYVSPTIHKDVARMIHENENSKLTYLKEPLSVIYTNDPQTVRSWINTNVTDGGMILGFDTESVPNAPWVKPKNLEKGDIATIQLSTISSCLLIQLTRNNSKSQKNNTSTDICPLLSEIIQNPNIIKVGVGVKRDMEELAEWNRCHYSNSSGGLDVGGGKKGHHIEVCGKRGVPMLKNKVNDNRMVGLKKLCESITGVQIEKSKSVTVSDWSCIPLSNRQVAYAARDAWASSAIMDVLYQYDSTSFCQEELLKLTL